MNESMYTFICSGVATAAPVEYTERGDGLQCATHNAVGVRSIRGKRGQGCLGCVVCGGGRGRATESGLNGAYVGTDCVSEVCGRHVHCTH